MSFIRAQDHLNPDDPLYYAPRWLRHEDNSPSGATLEATSAGSRPGSSPPRYDELAEEAVAESLRHPSHPEAAASEPAAFAYEQDYRRALFGVAGRFAAAVGVAAIVAFFFVIMVPTSQKNDPSELAVSEYRTMLASASAAQTKTTPEESEALLRKFVQWQQRR
jgi:hypothetical protein